MTTKNSKPVPLVNFRVPHTPEGLDWIDKARAYVNRDRFSNVTARPRGGTRVGYFDCARDDCKFFGIYLRERPEIEAARREREAKYTVSIYEHRQALEHANATNNRIFGQLQGAEEAQEAAETKAAEAVAALDYNEATSGETIGELERSRNRWIAGAVVGVLLGFAAGAVASAAFLAGAWPV
jgi:hypothetical protein